jgi:hypothetical protein
MISIKTKRILTPQRVLAIAALAFLIVMSLLHPLYAQTVTQGYG